MNHQKIAGLTFDQLNQIQDCVQKAKAEKKREMEQKAKTEILALIDKNYPDLDLVSFAKELLNHGKHLEEIKYLRTQEKIFGLCKNSPEFSNSILRYFDVDGYINRLKAISKAVLISDETRLLWLTNDGGQKTSNVSGKELSNVLQETIKKLERLSTLEIEQNCDDYISEIWQVSKWSEDKLGISLIKGTFTVISPYFSRSQKQRESKDTTFSEKDCLRNGDEMSIQDSGVYRPGL